jgi:hypothetical protein
VASAVDIANLALANLGDPATVSSLSPPDGSAQAQHCARFYPIARTSAIEQAAWDFASTRAYLALVSNPWSMWRYAYAMPSNALSVISILPKEAISDYSERACAPDGFIQWPAGYFPPSADSIYTPQPFSIETFNGQLVILTDVCDAVARYTFDVSDTTKFSGLFTEALAWKLASMLAGPMIKGDAGAAQAVRCMQMFNVIKGQAESSDANQRQIKPHVATPWIVGR